MSHGSDSIFNACRKRQHTEIILNNFVSNQAGFISLLLIRGQTQMRAHDREKVASLSCHVSCCVSKVRSIKASLTGVFLFLLCSNSNTLYPAEEGQLLRFKCILIQALFIYLGKRWHLFHLRSFVMMLSNLIHYLKFLEWHLM